MNLQIPCNSVQVRLRHRECGRRLVSNKSAQYAGRLTDLCAKYFLNQSKRFVAVTEIIKIGPVRQPPSPPPYNSRTGL